jgi:hypothetical protein
MDKREIALRFETPLAGPFDMFFLRNENDKVRIGIREGMTQTDTGLMRKIQRNSEVILNRTETDMKWSGGL